MVEYLDYMGEKLPFRTSYYALKHISEGDNVVDLQELLGSGDITRLEPLLYHSLVMGAKLTKTDLELEESDMEFVLDVCMFEFIEKLPTFFPKLKVGGMEQVVKKQTKKSGKKTK